MKIANFVKIIFKFTVLLDVALSQPRYYHSLFQTWSRQVFLLRVVRILYTNL